MKEQLIHILDQSVCLSRKQMKEYLSGTMLPEETHAAEVHLNSCPLCSLAMEGFSEHSEQALQAIAALNSGFLKDHFDNISPQIHLNSMAPAAAMQMSKSDRKRSVQPLWRVGSIAAAMLLLFGLVWAFERSHNREANVPVSVAVNASNGGGSGNGTGRSDNTPDNSGTGEVVNAASASTGLKPQIENNTTTGHNQAAVGLSAAKNGTGVRPGTSSVARQAGSLASGSTVSGAGSIPQQDASTSMAMKEPPATKTFVEYDPSAAEQSDKKEPAPITTPAVASKSVASTSEPKVKTLSAAPPKTTDDTRDDAERGDDSYSKGSYGTALNLYKKGMNSGDDRIRYHSMVMAAQCYAALGNKPKAEELLQRVVDNGPGPDRRAAKRALRKLH